MMPSSQSIVSVIVTVGFFGALFMFLVRPIVLTGDAWTALNIMLGALASQFAAVVQYNIGSSVTSKTKDDTIKSLSEMK